VHPLERVPRRVPFEVFIGAIGPYRGEHVEGPEPGLQEMMATCCKTGGVRFDPPARRVAIDGLELAQRGNQPVDVVGRAAVDNIGVQRRDGDALQDCRHTADHNAFDAMTVKDFQGLPELRKAAHCGGPRRCRQTLAELQDVGPVLATASSGSAFGRLPLRTRRAEGWAPTGGELAGHASTRTTQLYDRRREPVEPDEIERVKF
jgi:hypothetical protein